MSGPSPRTRAFVAFHLPTEFRSAASALQAPLRASPWGRDVKWVEPGNLHLTIRFLGELGPGELESAQLAVASLDGAFEPISAALGSVSAFPDERRPRVIWCAVQSRPEGDLERIARAAEAALDAAGFPPAEQAWIAHVTLGRVRERVTLPRAALRLTVPEAVTSIAEILLIKSELRREGPLYHAIGRARARSSVH